MEFECFIVRNLFQHSLCRLQLWAHWPLFLYIGGLIGLCHILVGSLASFIFGGSYGSLPHIDLIVGLLAFFMFRWAHWPLLIFIFIFSSSACILFQLKLEFCCFYTPISMIKNIDGFLITNEIITKENRQKNAPITILADQ